MKSPLSPSDIEVLIWCHAHPEPHPRIDAPAVKGAVEMWFAAGMLRHTATDDDVFATTDKGKAMIAALCKTPEPRAVWVDAQDNILFKA